MLRRVRMLLVAGALALGMVAPALPAQAHPAWTLSPMVARGQVGTNDLIVFGGSAFHGGGQHNGVTLTAELRKQSAGGIANPNANIVDTGFSNCGTTNYCPVLGEEYDVVDTNITYFYVKLIVRWTESGEPKKQTILGPVLFYNCDPSDMPSVTDARRRSC